MRIQYPDRGRALMQVWRHRTERAPVPEDPSDTWVRGVLSDYQRRLKAVANAFMVRPGAQSALRETAERMARESKQWRPVTSLPVDQPLSGAVAVELYCDGRMFHTWCAPADSHTDLVCSGDPRLLRQSWCSGCAKGWYE